MPSAGFDQFSLAKVGGRRDMPGGSLSDLDSDGEPTRWGEFFVRLVGVSGGRAVRAVAVGLGREQTVWSDTEMAALRQKRPSSEQPFVPLFPYCRLCANVLGTQPPQG